MSAKNIMIITGKIIKYDGKDGIIYSETNGDVAFRSTSLADNLKLLLPSQLINVDVEAQVESARFALRVRRARPPYRTHVQHVLTSIDNHPGQSIAEFYWLVERGVEQVAFLLRLIAEYTSEMDQKVVQNFIDTIMRQRAKPNVLGFTFQGHECVHEDDAVVGGLLVQHGIWLGRLLAVRLLEETVSHSDRKALLLSSHTTGYRPENVLYLAHIELREVARSHYIHPDDISKARISRNDPVLQIVRINTVSDVLFFLKENRLFRVDGAEAYRFCIALYDLGIYGKTSGPLPYVTKSERYITTYVSIANSVLTIYLGPTFQNDFTNRFTEIDRAVKSFGINQLIVKGGYE